MTIIRLTGDYNDPWCVCDECEMSYQVIFNRNAVHSGIEYCPFCGDSVDEFVDEMKATGE